VPGIERRDQALDRPALPGGIPALEEDAERGPDLLRPDLPPERQPELGQALPPVLQRLPLLLLGEGLGEIDLVEAPDGAILSERAA